MVRNPVAILADPGFQPRWRNWWFVFARENSGWCARIIGALANLGHHISDQTVGNILRRLDIAPAPRVVFSSTTTGGQRKSVDMRRPIQMLGFSLAGFAFKVLLVAHVLVGGYKHVKTALFGAGTQVAVAQRIPSPVFRLRDCVAGQGPRDALRRHMVKENEHSRRGGDRRVEAPGGELKHGVDLFPRNIELLNDLVYAGSSFEVSNTADTGMRVFLNTHAPLSRPGTLSTAGHWDQSRVAMLFTLLSS